MKANKKKKLIRALLSQYDEMALSVLFDQVESGYKEMIAHCRPLLTRGNTYGKTVGIVIALRQLADNITEQAGNMGMPFCGEMVELFNEGFKLGSVAWTKEAQKEDGEQ